MIFLSKYGQQVVILKSATYDYINVEGQSKPTRLRVPGKSVEFRELSGQGGRGGMLAGLPGIPENKGFRGMYETNDPEEIQAILDHAGYGRDFVGLTDDGSGILDSDSVWVPLSRRGGSERWMCLLNGEIYQSKAGRKKFEGSAEFKRLMEEKEQGLRSNLAYATG